MAPVADPFDPVFVTLSGTDPAFLGIDTTLAWTRIATRLFAFRVVRGCCVSSVRSCRRTCRLLDRVWREADLDGTPFGRYRLITVLGRGGMGEVWRAHDTETDRIVAIKLLPSYLSEDQEFQRRFRREAHAAARLNNPHVISIHNYGEIDGRLDVDMQLIEGRDLQTLLADGPLDPARAVRIIDQVAKALHAAHEVGLLHRDIKPSNILLDRDDFAYLIDFGIARAVDETRMTKSGNTIGTLLHEMPSPSSDWTVRQPHARGWLG
jgi:serine/threonine protein kinase